MFSRISLRKQKRFYKIIYSKKSQPEKFGKNLFSDVLTFYTIRTTTLFYYLNNFMTDSVLFLLLEGEGEGGA